MKKKPKKLRKLFADLSPEEQRKVRKEEARLLRLEIEAERKKAGRAP